jgi:nucleoid-associated protein YgaU
MFAPTSRYRDVETAELEGPDGRVVVYIRRRFLPPLAGVTVLAEHSVVGGDRIDNLSARYYGDPEAFWRIADANDAMRPADLTDEIGRVVVIAVPTAGR